MDSLTDIIFFIPLVGDLPEIEESLYLTITMDSLVKLHIFQIKKSLTNDQKKHHAMEENTHRCPLF